MCPRDYSWLASLFLGLQSAYSEGRKQTKINRIASFIGDTFFQHLARTTFCGGFSGAGCPTPPAALSHWPSVSHSFFFLSCGRKAEGKLNPAVDPPEMEAVYLPNLERGGGEILLR